MDSLPAELIEKILILLPGTEVSKFRRLNSTVGRVVDLNKNRLLRVFTNIKFINADKEPEKIVSVKINDKYGYVISRLEYININVKRWEFTGCSRKFDDPLFHNGNIPSNALRFVLKCLLDKGEVEDLDLRELKDPQCISTLTDVIENRSTYIRRISINFDMQHLRLFSDAIACVASQKRRIGIVPSLRICYENTVSDTLSLQTLNYNASLFTSAFVECAGTQFNPLIGEITKAWRERPFGNFSFYIKVNGKVKIIAWRSAQFTQDFEVYEEDYEENEHEKTLRLEDKTTGNMIFFKKKQGEYVKGKLTTKVIISAVVTL